MIRRHIHCCARYHGGDITRVNCAVSICNAMGMEAVDAETKDEDLITNN